MVAQRPNYIPLPPQRFSFSTDIDPNDNVDLSPQFHTAPSTPDPPSPQFFYTPPTSPPSDLPSHDDPPLTVNLAIELALADDSLSTLEKIYLYSRSRATFHRVFIPHALPSCLDDVSPQEATEYVLPLLTALAMDDGEFLGLLLCTISTYLEEQVKEALAVELASIIWWFFTHCKVVSGDSSTDTTTLAEATISVQAFTPILGTLLLSSNPHVGGIARYAVVDLLGRLRKADDREARLSSDNRYIDDNDIDLAIGLFGSQERAMFQEEILQQVVIGISHLDTDPEYQDTSLREEKSSLTVGNAIRQDSTEHVLAKDTVNPYFPHRPLPPLDTSPASSKNLNPHSSRSFTDSPPSNEFASTGQRSRSSPSDGLSFEQTSYTDQRQFSAPGLVRPQLVGDVPAATGQPAAPVIQLNPMKQGHLSLDLIDALPTAPPSDRDTHDKDDVEYDITHDRIMGFSWNCTCDDQHDHHSFEDQKAAVGRLSSMSLMAAVTASGPLGENTQQAFVKELQRVGRDPIPWVRTEASFALGALAKVVPDEVVQCSLLPLFDQLCWDTAWRVRHSAVFALPAILARLCPHERRKLALGTTIGLAGDENPTVRLGVLEVLGEVLYTFHGVEDGVPEDLLGLFLGKEIRPNLQPPLPHRGFALDLFLQEPKRPLICAFNYPAVVLALGRERWKDVRDLYLSLAAETDFKVRRTIAASLGELAKIIGEDNAHQDLIHVWWNALKSDSEEIRLKALEIAEVFSEAVGRRAGASIISGIHTVWDEGGLKTWRERDCVAKSLGKLSQWGHEDIPLIIYGLLQHALEDNVAAVRESAIASLPQIRSIFANQPDFLLRLHDDLLSLAGAATYRRRMTFVACWQAMINSEKSLDILDNDTLDMIAELANDSVDGVRIGTARLVGAIFEKHVQNVVPMTGTLLRAINRLSHDNCYDVRAYMPNLTNLNQRREQTAPSKPRTPNVFIFSRPPRYHGYRRWDRADSQLGPGYFAGGRI